MSTQSTVCIIITIVLYLLFMLYLGFRFTNANQSVGDFYLGGRKLGPLVTAMSAGLGHVLLAVDGPARRGLPRRYL